MYAAYFTRCRSWSTEALRPLVAQTPLRWAQAFEPFLSRDDIRATICEELAKRIAATRSNQPRDGENIENVENIVAWLARNNLLGEVSAAGIGWPLDSAALLADRLAPRSEYDGRLYRRIASGLIASADMDVWASWGDWLDVNRDRCGAAGQMMRALLAVREDQPGATLPEPDEMLAADYEHALDAAVRLISREMHDQVVIQALIADLLCKRYPAAGLRFLERLLDSPVFPLALRAAESASFLDAVNRSGLISRLQRSPGARQTANQWLALDREARRPILTREQRRQLESFVPRACRSGGFFRRLFRRQ